MFFFKLLTKRNFVLDWTMASVLYVTVVNLFLALIYVCCRV